MKSNNILRVLSQWSLYALFCACIYRRISWSIRFL